MRRNTVHACQLQSTEPERLPPPRARRSPREMHLSRLQELRRLQNEELLVRRPIALLIRPVVIVKAMKQYVARPIPAYYDKNYY